LEIQSIRTPEGVRVKLRTRIPGSSSNPKKTIHIQSV
jgi:hypothetical protein